MRIFVFSCITFRHFVVEFVGLDMLLKSSPDFGCGDENTALACSPGAHGRI